MNAIIDYDSGNIAAMANNLQRLGLRSVITAQPEQVERIIFPSNGSFDACANSVQAAGFP